MPIDRPKILTRFTVPTGGWTLTLEMSEAGQFDQTVTATVPAGDYYVAWDGQTDDFLWKLANVVNVALDGAAGLPTFPGRSVGIAFKIDQDHKVGLTFMGAWFTDAVHRDVRIDWTATDGASIAAVLGFDSSATLDLTGVDEPVATADWPHAYGWYADDPGMLAFLGIENSDKPNASQSFAVDGHSKTQYLGSQRRNELRLNYIPRTKTWSGGVSYGAASVYPYTRNEPLECWFREARLGTEFRVYRSNVIDAEMAKTATEPEIANASDAFQVTADAATTVTGGNRSWATSPDQWAGRLLIVPRYDVVNDDTDCWPMRHHIASNTATVLTVSQRGEPQRNVANGIGGTTFLSRLYDQPYNTYVLDIGAMGGGFDPRELEGIDKFAIDIPLVRYET